MSKSILRFAALACLLSAPALAAEQYDASLGPAPLNDAMRVDLAGHGMITGSLDGTTLTLSGSFDGLHAAATNGRLLMGLGIGVPDAKAKIADLAVTPGDMSGTLSGKVTLTRAQQVALRTGKLYITVGSAKYPEGNGMLWGWILPAHQRAADNEPEQGHWFLPNIDVPKK
jgi:CHRD domain